MMLKIVVVLLLLFSWSGTSHADEMAEAQRFWNQFRHAALVGDVKKVASMTRFPLWVRGVADSDPVMYCREKDFPQIWKQLLEQQVVVSDIEQVEVKTMLQVIRNKKVVTQKDLQSPQLMSVELFWFEKIKDRWYMTRGYLEE